jgi:hypothetical protein
MPAQPIQSTAEFQRVQSIDRGEGWRRWGPYVSERQWGTVREDYSQGGTAWDYFPHDHARSRAYRWGEDGIGGFGDERLRWCLGVALWNGNDPILKERLFGLTNSQGNHGEDVKEHYVYQDATPSHSYQRMLYRYPHAAYPYQELIDENARRGKHDPEFEIYDTGVFADDAYFDIIIEYAKADPDDILMRVTAINRGSTVAALHLLPQFWGRNTWSWTGAKSRASITRLSDGGLCATRPTMADLRLDFDGADEVLFCNNETNSNRLFGTNVPGPFKDGINDFIVHGLQSAVNRESGSKLALLRRATLQPGASTTMRLRLRARTNHASSAETAFTFFDDIFQRRKDEAGEFYAALTSNPAMAAIDRAAFAGLLWSKQFYYLDIPRWLEGDPAEPPPPASRTRNVDWQHLNNADIVSMPDKWEYPWYASWDLAFHCVTLARIDPSFAKDQLVLLTREWYMHPNGQMPAYEWAFGDVNPPVHAGAAWQVFQTDQRLTGRPDFAFLERVFHKLMLNFTWWVNRKDKDGHGIFQGGFLGLDNIGIFDRSKPLPTGGTIDQADGTAWMAMYALNMMRIALELACQNSVYEDMASKFFEHFLAIADAMTGMGTRGTGLWDESDGFFYDVLALDNGQQIEMRLRSIVGLIPIFAVSVLSADIFVRLPDFAKRTRWILANRPELAKLVSRWTEPGQGESHLLSLLRGHRLKCLLQRMLDPEEFLSPYGIRSISKAHTTPYILELGGQAFEISYQPGESESGTFGGNSNWRGPVWFPINFLLIVALREFHAYYGDDFTVECPIGSGKMCSLNEVADELTRRLQSLFQRNGENPAPFAGTSLPQGMGADDLLFHEYFHGDTGKGLGAAHQMGWTAFVAALEKKGQGLCPWTPLRTSP